MKKIVNYVLLVLLINFVFLSRIYAGSYNVSVTSSSVTIGNSVTLNISGSGLAGKFSISSSNGNILSLSQNSVWIDNDTASITVNTLNTGSATLTITPVDVTDYDGNAVTGGRSIGITVNAKPVVNNKPKEKSSNNFLSGLSVSGLELDKTFDKETLEYSVIAPEETEKIVINAQLADSNATVTGVGEQTVTTGTNTFEIVVSAENGSKRTYKLNVTVKELKPITVKVDGKEYTVVRKRKDLPEISEYFKEADIKIDEELIPGYENEKLKYEVVGLKNKDGVIEYYIYNKGKYNLYKEYSFNGIILNVLDKEIDKGYKKTTFVYDNEKINSYQEVKRDIIKNTYALDDNEINGNQFYLFYAKNVETGKESLYQYDAVEKTVQRYNTQILDMYKDSSDTYYMYLLISILLMVVIVVIFSIVLICKSKKRKK